MNINFEKNGQALHISLDGRLDTNTAPTFERFLQENLDGMTTLVIDCEKLAYISSAGLRVLLGAQKKMKTGMKLTQVQELVMEVFEVTGFADILVIE